MCLASYSASHWHPVVILFRLKTIYSHPRCDSRPVCIQPRGRVVTGFVQSLGRVNTALTYLSRLHYCTAPPSACVMKGGLSSMVSAGTQLVLLFTLTSLPLVRCPKI